MKRIIIGLVITAVVIVVALRYINREPPRGNVLVADGSSALLLMDFRQPFSIDPPPEGWYHRTFMRHGPMDISFVTKDQRPALRLATQDSASMLIRQVDVPLATYRDLTWEWLIEQPIETDLDERTVKGDDHPARLYLKFEASDGETHAMEILWGNRHLKKGDWKHLTFFFIFEFPHYTANGGAENVGRWHQERVSLQDLYRELWGDPAGARLIEIGLFCDTDETDAASIAYFSDVRVERNPAQSSSH